MFEWLMAHKVIVLVGLGVAGAAFFMLRQAGSPSGSSGGIGGATPNNSVNSADPINSQLTGLQEQLANAMAAIAAKFPGNSPIPGAPGGSTGGAATGVGNSGTTAAVGTPVQIIPASIITPLPVSAEPWQPPVAAPLAASAPLTINIASAPATPVAGAYLGTSLGEKQYAKTPTGPDIIAQLRIGGAVAGLQPPTGLQPITPVAAPTAAKPFSLAPIFKPAPPPPTPVYRPAPAPVYHPTPAQSSSAYGGTSLGEGQYIKPAPAPPPSAPVESVTHGKITSF